MAWILKPKFHVPGLHTIINNNCQFLTLLDEHRALLGVLPFTSAIPSLASLGLNLEVGLSKSYLHDAWLCIYLALVVIRLAFHLRLQRTIHPQFCRGGRHGMVERPQPHDLMCFGHVAFLFRTLDCKSVPHCQLQGISMKAPRKPAAFSPWILKMSRMKLLASKKRLSPKLGLILIQDFCLPQLLKLQLQRTPRKDIHPRRVVTAAWKR